MLGRIALAALLSGANALPQQAQPKEIVDIISKAAAYISVDDFERFVDQFAHHPAPNHEAPEASRRQMQSTTTPTLTLPTITDDVRDEAHNGWLDAQQWRTFTSTVGRPADRAAGDVVINYVTARCPAGKSCTRGGVVVSVGHTEPVDKYAEQIWDLVDKGFSPVYALDHRGQGRSTRLLGDEPFKSHVERGSDFVTDLRSFVALVDGEMTSEGNAKRFLHCHSMGCAVALTYVLEEYYAQRAPIFHAVAANAPLIKPVTDPFPYDVAVLVAQAMLAIGLDTSHPPTKGKTFHEFYCADATCASPNFSPSRSDRQNIQYGRCHAYQNYVYPAGHAGLCLGDVTARFAYEFFSMYDTFAAFTLGSLSTPILVQQAGTSGGNDGLVLNSEQDAFCAQAGASCRLRNYPTSAHNIWFETDAIRDPALAEVYAFYDEHAQSTRQQNNLPRTCTWWEPWCATSWCDCVWSCSHPAARC